MHGPLLPIAHSCWHRRSSRSLGSRHGDGDGEASFPPRPGHPLLPFSSGSLGSLQSLHKLGCDPPKLSSNGNLWAVRGLLRCLCSQDSCSGGCPATDWYKQESEERGLGTLREWLHKDFRGHGPNGISKRGLRTPTFLILLLEC